MEFLPDVGNTQPILIKISSNLVLYALKKLQRLNAAYKPNNFVCRHCFDWDYNHPSMKEPKPENYPSNEHPNSPQPPKGREIIDITYLRPIELSYELLIQGVKYCFYNCYHGYWTKTSAMVYLKSIGINEFYGSNYVYHKALECQTNNDVTEANLYENISYPVHWVNGISLNQCIDTPMHQIFQGVVKSIIKKTMSWLTKKIIHITKRLAITLILP